MLLTGSMHRRQSDGTMNKLNNILIFLMYKHRFSQCLIAGNSQQSSQRAIHRHPLDMVTTSDDESGTTFRKSASKPSRDTNQMSSSPCTDPCYLRLWSLVPRAGQSRLLRLHRERTMWQPGSTVRLCCKPSTKPGRAQGTQRPKAYTSGHHHKNLVQRRYHRTFSQWALRRCCRNLCSRIGNKAFGHGTQAGQVEN